MQKTLKNKNELSNNQRRLICEVRNIAQKISRNRSKGYSTEKLETAFAQKRAMLEDKGIKIKDYAMFTA